MSTRMLFVSIATVGESKKLCGHVMLIDLLVSRNNESESMSTVRALSKETGNVMYCQ